MSDRPTKRGTPPEYDKIYCGRGVRQSYLAHNQVNSVQLRGSATKIYIFAKMNGGLAQLGERCTGSAEVAGSTPAVSTIFGPIVLNGKTLRSQRGVRGSMPLRSTKKPRCFVGDCRNHGPVAQSGRVAVLHTVCREFKSLRAHQFNRSIAQPGSAPALGAGGREFDPPYSDHF